MRPLDLQSERYSATGNVASEGVLNQLGRPNLDMLAVLVRETVQNSWDARASEDGVVQFGMFGRTLTDKEMYLLRQTIFFNHSSYPSLSKALLSNSNFQVLGIYDRGTTGLGGPTRADRVLDETEPRNFVNFLRNVGLPSDKHLGGGTFGYGKAALYLASSIRTICIHTHCLSKGKLESRFIAAALGPRYEMKGVGKERYQYTGRHWWGNNEDGVVEPTRGFEADELANHLGLPRFVEGECGTTILMLLPILGERSLLQTLQLASTHILWNCWPKMCKFDRDNPSMMFELNYEGQSISIPDPHDFPPLQGFAQAMENLKRQPLDNDDDILSQFTSIECLSPKQRLGSLSLQCFSVKERQEQLTNGDEVFPFTGLSHHVALMRKPELVVKYVQGPPLPSSQIEYAGVFIVDERIDHIFAKAEPPTHDDWAYQSLEDSHGKTFVRVALRRIQEALRRFTLPPLTGNRGIGILPLGAFADRLGGLLLGSEGPGAAVQPFTQKNSGARVEGKGALTNKSEAVESKGNKPDIKKQPTFPTKHVPKAKAKLNWRTRTLGFADDIPALLVEFTIEHESGSQGTKVQIEINALLDGDELEKDPPVGAPIPRVLYWIDPDKSKYGGSSEIMIPAFSTGIWGAAIGIPDDTVISVNLTVSEDL